MSIALLEMLLNATTGTLPMNSTAPSPRRRSQCHHRPGSIRFLSNVRVICHSWKLSLLCLKNSGSIGTTELMPSGLLRTGLNVVRERKLTGSRPGNSTSQLISRPDRQTCISPLWIHALPVSLQGKPFGFSNHRWPRSSSTYSLRPCPRSPSIAHFTRRPRP